MQLTKDESVDIILLAGSGTNRHEARIFNVTHRIQITHDTAAKLIMNFKDSVADASRSVRIKTATDGDEANFCVSGEVIKQNVMYWIDSDPRWMSDRKSQGAEKLMAWCGIWGDRIFDEANFCVSGEVIKQNVMYWIDSDPRWMSDRKSQGAEKLMAWCGIWGDRIFG
ncbi:hypothetical protein AVEN_129247-1 [Araneus ventricosus]|uniref:Uncharacterized protein n=1 Tax=Araneus ventricosus TaxID=182803 RepID=A0A4Y2RCF4_ARAVE|nr:hypothetical protein AVEN_129247-1 [Araneus ventricosus]